MYFDKELYWAPECEQWDCLNGFKCDTVVKNLPANDLEEGEIPNLHDDEDDNILIIPKINQCTMCGKHRLAKFRYCYPCMIQYHSKWYELYSITETNIDATHKFESHHGYGKTCLHTKVELHHNYGNPVFIAVNRLGSLIAHQHLLPNHELDSDSTHGHKFAAMHYLRSAVGNNNIWVDFIGCDLKITSDTNDIYLNMCANNIMEQLYGVVDMLRT